MKNTVHFHSFSWVLHKYILKCNPNGLSGPSLYRDNVVFITIVITSKCAVWDNYYECSLLFCIQKKICYVTTLNKVHPPYAKTITVLCFIILNLITLMWPPPPPEWPENMAEVVAIYKQSFTVTMVTYHYCVLCLLSL